MTTGGNLFAQQEANRKASLRLVAGFILFIAWLGFGGDLVWYLATRDAVNAYGQSTTHVVPFVGMFLTAIAAAMAWAGYRFGPVALLKATGAREVGTPANELEQRLVNVVEEMAIASGAPRPGIWIVPDDHPNAFATGIKVHQSYVAVTEGLLDNLTREELQAVVAHEMGHIVNLDVRLMTLLTALVGAVAILHQGGFRMMLYGGGRRSRSSSDRGGGAGPLVVILFALWIVSWIIAPLVTRFMVMKVGRSREYLADAMSAQFTRNPGALASALTKLGTSTIRPTAIPKSSAALCISDPYHSKWDEREGRMANLMATHPPLRERVSRLEQMAYLRADAAVEALPSPPAATVAQG
ncbi:MAG: M48 family metallopeptidase [Gemmatimonadaceae bacterium]